MSIEFGDSYPDIAKFDLSKADQVVSSIAMGTDDITMTCTQGKVTIWFGKKTPENQVTWILTAISNVDSSMTHEMEVICDFSDIEKYEGKEYILVSYAKARGGYRAIFNIPFSKREALEHLAEAIFEQLQHDPIRKDFFWDGCAAKIMLLFDELSSIDGWRIKKVDFRKDITASGE
ncbi:MAG: hypothetical protein IB616_01845 [Methanosarcinales archaeon]|nr:MAG: hypothetical protein IB616_01845 [Methanosarcinales archaeon]